jgi:hypothetical protein
MSLRSQEIALPGIYVVELESRKDCYIRLNQIAGIMELKEEGPTRILFSQGGHIDVCGSAEQWSVKIRLVEIQTLGS